MPLHFILSFKYRVTPPPICPAFSSCKVGSLATPYPTDYPPPTVSLGQLLHQGCHLSPGILIPPSYFLNTKHCCTGMFCPSSIAQHCWPRGTTRSLILFITIGLFISFPVFSEVHSLASIKEPIKIPLVPEASLFPEDALILPFCPINSSVHWDTGFLPGF